MASSAQELTFEKAKTGKYQFVVETAAKSVQTVQLPVELELAVQLPVEVEEVEFELTVGVIFHPQQIQR